ncbi:phenylalanine--tRNA ligase subunit beta [Corynebacterium otitidis]|uniref:phenylalanine--tRNA ligase subunit beta n=1 Tax=Corynebacterium otitidis TaxID=29321 RepID=UPI0006279B9B|nr:phenylalanine--tRNA ligase subunit beta [Corynebacterium otitidis]KKO83587.1 phenylalanyl-tRNA synthetase subunit beta [Corynebacterium otitidis]
MLISQNWLTDILAHANEGFAPSSEEVDRGFVSVGFETEGYAPIPESTGPIVVGRVDSIEELEGFKKPIRYCAVDVGDANGTGEPQRIICGARNFREGSHVVVCLPGAVLPGDFRIEPRKTYDHISEGMLASAAELGLATKQNSGIIDLGPNPGIAPGTDARDVVGLNDTVFEVNVTPDRGYALSARGLTRELSSAFGLSFTDLKDDPEVGLSAAARGADVPRAALPEVAGEALPVELREETGAARFGLREVRGVKAGAESPLWLQRILMLSGIRPVNVATDVTNLVMILLGQPMHAFDAARVEGPLVVRKAAAGEQLETLDHTEHELDPDDVVIVDDRGPVSLAGVMGGLRTEIAEDTDTVLLEAARWDELGVARAAKRHKLPSEASRRFERGVDPALVESALDVAARLLAGLGGGEVAAGRTLVGDVPEPASIEMAASRPATVAGVDYPRETVVARLKEVGCAVVGEETLTVTPPTWRGDLVMPADLVEEVVRLEGLEDIPLELPSPRGGRGLTPAQRRRRAVGHALAYNGYAEIIPSPFLDATVFDSWGLDADDPLRNTVAVQNPLDRDYDRLATTLLPAMLEALGRNVARGLSDARLYSVAQVSFRGEDRSPMPSVKKRPSEEEVAAVVGSLPAQPLHVATVGAGSVVPAGPWGEGRGYAWSDAVESARLVARTAGVELGVANAERAPWHPGRCAELSVGGVVVGYAGELHPKVLQELGLPERTCAMELDLSALPIEDVLPAPVLSSFPALHQDIALVVDTEVSAAKVRAVIIAAAGEWLEDATLFDVYRSDQLGEGRKSLAFTLRFRAPDRTLTDTEVNGVRAAIAEQALEKLGAELRE